MKHKIASAHHQEGGIHVEAIEHSIVWVSNVRGPISQAAPGHVLECDTGKRALENATLSSGKAHAAKAPALAI